MLNLIFLQSAGNPGMMNLIFFGGIILVFYFFIIRPQQKKQKNQNSFITDMAKGDEVVTNGGMIGKVAKVGDDFITITLADGVDAHFQKAAVASVLPKGTIKSI